MKTSYQILKQINHNWSLFLDRDGVINERLVGDYVKKREEFVFLPNVIDAISLFSKRFNHIFVVTNQQGIGKKLVTLEQVTKIHDYMVDEIVKSGGKIDKIYVAPHLQSENSIMRKPAPGMAFKAKKEFLDVHFKQSLMVGDSISDMQFGKRLGMKTIFISEDVKKCREYHTLIDLSFASLWDFAQSL